MTHFDIGRRQDLIDLENRYKKADTSERFYIERTFTQIMRESGKTRQLRDKMIQALRGDDRRAVNYYREELLKLKQDETWGEQF
jgi:hypothetical protein